MPNLERHIENIRKFGLEVLVAINHFVSDTDKEIQLIKEYCSKLKVIVNLCKHWAEGGSGARGLAENVVEICKNSNKEKFKYLYPDNTEVKNIVDVKKYPDYFPKYEKFIKLK